MTTGRTGGQRLAAGRGSWVAKNRILTRPFSETANRQRFYSGLKSARTTIGFDLALAKLGRRTLA